jgi:hypothetical protein
LNSKALTAVVERLRTEMRPYVSSNTSEDASGETVL